MENYKYIKVPNQISLSEFIQNDFCLAPSKYSRFSPNDSVKYLSLKELCTESKKKIIFNTGNEYHYSEIGDIDVNNGSVNQSKYFGIKLPSENPKEIKQGDIVISTVRTYRGGIGFVYNNLRNHCCSPAILVIRSVNSIITKEYLLSVLRTDFFIEQILGFQNRGMYPRLDKEAMKHVLIPIPKKESTLKYVTIITKAYQNKINEINKRHNSILYLIEKELLTNQEPNKFQFELPTYKEIRFVERLDTNLYREYFKKEIFIIKNYNGGYKAFQDFGFKLIRGNNLAISVIGKSVYSDTEHPNFYKLLLPKNIDKYGTIIKKEFLGNPNNLLRLKKGDIVFGAEGFEKGRSVIVFDESEKSITNFHGMTIRHESENLNTTIYFKCLLDYLRSKGLIDLYATGGNGGSLSQSYWNTIPFPVFGKEKQNEIIKLYHNPKIKYQTDTFTLDNFMEQDNAFNETAGIYELDNTAKQLKEMLNKAIDDIINDREVNIFFSREQIKKKKN